MNLEFLNTFGKSFQGGNIRFIDEKNAFFFNSHEFLFIYFISERKIRSFDFGFKSYIITFDCQLTGSLVSILFEKGHLVFFDFKHKKIKGKLTFQNQCLKIKWTPFKKYFTTLTVNSIQLWQYKFFSNKKVFDFFLKFTFEIDCSKIHDFDWEKTGKSLVLGGTDGTIRIFNMKKCKYKKKKFCLKYEQEIKLIRFGIDSTEFWILTKTNILNKFKILRKNSNPKLKHFNGKNFFLKEKSCKLKKEVGLITISEFDLNSKCIFQGYATGILNIFEIPSEENILKKNLEKEWHLNFFIAPFKRIEFFKFHISSLSFSKNLDIILVSSHRHPKIFVLDKFKPKNILFQNDSKAIYTSMDISYNDKLVCTGNSKGILQIWSLNIGTSLLFFKNHFKEISKVLFLKKTSRFVISCSYDGIIKIFDLKQLCVVKVMENLPGFEKLGFFDVNYSNKLITSSSKINGNVYLWSVKTGNLKEIIPNLNLDIVDLHFLEKKNKIILCSKTGVFKIWNLELVSNVLLKIKCKTICVNEELLAVANCLFYNHFIFLSAHGQLIALDIDTSEIRIVFSRFFEDLSNSHSRSTRGTNFILEFSKNRKNILINLKGKNLFILTCKTNRFDDSSWINKNKIFEKIETNFYISYSKKKNLKNDVVDIKNFYRSTDWIILYGKNLVILGSKNYKFNICSRDNIKKLKKSEMCLMRLIGRLFFEKNHFLLICLFFYFPIKIRAKLVSLILTNSIIKNILY